MGSRTLWYGSRNMRLASALCGLLLIVFAPASNAQEVHAPISLALASSQANLKDADTLRLFQPRPVVVENRYSWHSPITELPGDWFSAGEEALEKKSIPTWLMIGGATATLLLTDHATYHVSRTFYQRHAFVEHMSDAFVQLGEGTTHLGVAAGFGLYGLLTKDDRAVRTGGEVVEGLIATGVAVQLLKRMAGRESPATAPSGTSRWRPFPSLAGYQRNQPKYYSFPSGHIATTMATITVIAENYPEQRWIRPVGYGVLGMVGVSLVNVRYHWFSDLPLGMLLGYTFGELAAHHETSPGSTGRTQSSHLALNPSVSREGTGLQVSWSF